MSFVERHELLQFAGLAVLLEESSKHTRSMRWRSPTIARAVAAKLRRLAE